MKKFLALLLALVMVMGLATTAFAAENEGTIKNDTDRTYNAYQIFTGTQANGSAVLGDVAWGTGINSTDFLTALKNLEVDGAKPFASCTDAASVAAVLAGNANDSAIAKAFANLAAKHLGTVAATVAANENKTLPSGYYLLIDTSTTNPTQNPALLQVTNGSSLNITVKTPGGPTVDKEIKDEGDAATVSIGDSIPFVLTATLPSSLDGYDSYTLTFIDTLSKGLTYNKDAVVSAQGFTVTNKVNADGTTTITITNENILDNGIAAGAVITVNYTATVNENAVIGADGNTNKVKLKYSNDPQDETKTKETPEDEVKAFTFKLENTKVDGNTQAALANAEFVLLNSAKTQVATVVGGKLTGWVNVPAEGAAWPENTVLTSDAKGLFKVEGLNQGTYYLRETKAPAGYNLLKSDVEVVITATVTDTEDTQALTALTIKVGGNTENGDVATGKVSATITNNAGSTLPETGGMGTTMFYVFGGTMMLAALVLLVTKKRMADAV